MITEKHPLNKHFEWQPATGPFQMLNDEQVKSFNENGYCVLKNVLSKETIATITAATDKAEAASSAAMEKAKVSRYGIDHLGKISFTTYIAEHDESVKKFCDDDMFQTLGQDLMGHEVQVYHDQLVYKKPGMQENFPWHQDNGYVYLEPQQFFTCWMPLVDANENNGCPWVIPGLHKQGTLNHFNSEYGFVCVDEKLPKEAICCPVDAGDILVFSSLTPHMTGPNRTDEIRKSFIVQFCGLDAKRVVYGRESGRRFFSIKIRPKLDRFLVKQFKRPLLSRISMLLAPIFFK